MIQIAADEIGAPRHFIRSMVVESRPKRKTGIQGGVRQAIEEKLALGRYLIIISPFQASIRTVLAQPRGALLAGAYCRAAT